GGRKPSASSAPSVRKQQSGEDELPMLVLDDDLDEDMDEVFEPVKAPRRKKTLFFNWLQPRKNSAAAALGHERPAADRDQETAGESPLEGMDVWSGRNEALPADGAAALAPSMDDRDTAPPWEQEPEPAAAPAPSMWPESLAPIHGTHNEDAADSAIIGADAVVGVQAFSASAGTAAQDGQPGIKPSKPYLLPPMTLLARPQSGKSGPSDASDSKRKLESTLESFGVKATVLDVVRGPAVTRYEVQPATGVKVSRIVSLTDDIALALAAKDIRMEAPIPGKSAIGIEVPNTEVSMVTMREVMETPAFQQAPSKLSIAFGRDISGQPIIGNLARMPHLLVAGATGSGKSVCINGIITSILYKAAPDEVKFLMIDPKMVELNMYNGIPHLLAPVVTDPRRASLALKKIVVEMEKRYELFSKSGTRNIEGYNTLMKDNPAAVLPFIVVIVDELADLMMVAANDVEDAITRLAQMARAAGIHLIIATQRPSVDVITGVIKANIPSRIAFGVSSQVDSRTILDMVGAEKLLGRGDMLFLPVGMSKPIRVQGGFLSDQEVESVVHFAREQAQAEYKEDLVPEIEENGPEEDEIVDELFDQAVQIVVEAKQASVSLLQRRMRVGYTRAARLIDQMEARGVVGPYEGSKPREVLMSLDQFQAGKISS
ncbi:DNA translocase FtsK, partial [Paenibacillus darwinianus]